jgi:prepilin-type N-terminal cleavage/methylation domain-containing protein
MTARSASRPRAFTITELLVVISIIVLLIAIAVPAFSNLMSSSERSLAENQLKAGLAAARDAAIQSGYGDGAAVFVYIPNGRLAIIPCVVVGQIEDIDDPTQAASATNLTRIRDVLVPVANSEPMQLPRGWVVSAYAPPLSVYDGVQQTERWYESYSGGTAQAGQPGWITPETGFFDGTAAPSGTTRQSFIVRFKVGTGALDTGNRSTALVFDPVQETGFRKSQPYSDFRADQLRLPGTPPQIAPNAATWVQRVLGDRTDLTQQKRAQLLGDASLDTILVRPVTEIALYEEAKLAASIGAGSLNRATGSIYGDPSAPNAMPTAPSLDTSLFSGTPSAADVATRISQWIEGRYSPTGAAPFTPSDARIFTLQRYLGQVQEVAP